MASKQLKRKRQLGFLTHPDHGLGKMFNDWGYDMTLDLKFLGDADFVVFPGGADIYPPMYGHRRSEKCGAPDIKRDMKENAIFRSVPFDVPKIGICRGAQFLNIMNGGTLYQHVDGHANGRHLMRVLINKDFDVIEDRIPTMISVTSTHHQQMIPAMCTDNMFVFGIAHASKEKYLGVGGVINDDKKDYEVVFYKNTSSLCFQPHPEYTDGESDPCRAYFKGIFNTLTNFTPTVTEVPK